MLKKIRLQEAIGSKLAHDITEIRAGEFKGPAFRRGHTVCEADLCHLQRLGKNHLYVLDLAEDEIHENEAAVILARALAGDGVTWKNGPLPNAISAKVRDASVIMKYPIYKWNTTIFSSVISSTAYLGPSLPKPLCFNPP